MSQQAQETVVVPREPTEDMLIAGAVVGPDTNNGPFSLDDAREVYRTMIAAASRPKVEERG